MKNIFIITVLAVIALSISIPQVFALELKISQDGKVYFYEDAVLGDDDTEENEIEDESNDADENKIEDESNDADENKIEDERELGDLIKTTNLDGGKISIETDNEEIKVDIEKRSGSNKLESSKVNRFSMEIPSKKTKAQVKISEKNKTDIKQTREEHKAYLEKLKEERQARVEEQLELRNKQREDSTQEMELESRGVTARLTRAEFVYDSESGIVTLTTPSGNVHELNHFPDQALMRMEEVAADDLEEADIEVSTTEDGTIVYKTKGTKMTKFLGLFSRDIDTEIILVDETGEVIESELPAESLLGRLLNRLSF